MATEKNPNDPINSENVIQLNIEQNEEDMTSKQKSRGRLLHT